jgi:hypothetical protein
LLIAFVISQLEETVHSRDPLNHPVNLITFGMPLALSLLGVAMVFLVALLGSAFRDHAREWWYHVGGWTIIFTSGWVVLFTISLYGPPFVTWLTREIGVWASSTLTLGWLLPTVFAARYGMSEHGNATATRPITKRLLAIAPLIFVLGMLLLITVVIQSLITDPIFPRAAVVTLGDYFHTGFYASERTPIGLLLASIAGCVLVAIVLAWRVDFNKSSVHLFYRSGLVRCYLGASNASGQTDPYTSFDSVDDLHLAELLWKLEPSNNGRVHHLQKPFHLINTALNLVTGKMLAGQTRMAASFLFSPGYCEADWCQRSYPGLLSCYPRVRRRQTRRDWRQYFHGRTTGQTRTIQRRRRRREARPCHGNFRRSRESQRGLSQQPSVVVSHDSDERQTRAMEPQSVRGGLANTDPTVRFWLAGERIFGID